MNIFLTQRANQSLQAQHHSILHSELRNLQSFLVELAMSKSTVSDTETSKVELDDVKEMAENSMRSLLQDMGVLLTSKSTSPTSSIRESGVTVAMMQEPTIQQMVQTLQMLSVVFRRELSAAGVVAGKYQSARAKATSQEIELENLQLKLETVSDLIF